MVLEPGINSAFKMALQQSISRAESIQILLLIPNYLYAILTLSSHQPLGLPTGFPVIGSQVKIVKELTFSFILVTCPDHLNLLNLISSEQNFK